MLWINPEAHVHFNGLIELRKFYFLNESNGIGKLVRFSLYLLLRGSILLAAAFDS